MIRVIKHLLTVNVNGRWTRSNAFGLTLLCCCCWKAMAAAWMVVPSKYTTPILDHHHHRLQQKQQQQQQQQQQHRCKVPCRTDFFAATVTDPDPISSDAHSPFPFPPSRPLPPPPPSTSTTTSTTTTTSWNTDRDVQESLLLSLNQPKNNHDEDAALLLLFARRQPIQLGSSPATIFGSPLHPMDKKRNRELVHFLKSIMFDNPLLFGPPIRTTTTSNPINKSRSNNNNNHNDEINEESTNRSLNDASTVKEIQQQQIQQAYVRFYALETIARMPYFAYLSVLHLMETLGHWRNANYLKLHFAESWNELHHLLIMEELLLGESSSSSSSATHHLNTKAAASTLPQWLHRSIAQHVAFFYYWIAVVLYLFNPALAYNLNQAVEEEAYQTYDTFINKYQDYLKEQPAPQVAIEYYNHGSDDGMWDAMHTTIAYGERQQQGSHKNEMHDDASSSSSSSASPSSLLPRRARPYCHTLYDCFVAIRDDEWEHVRTMAHLQEDWNHLQQHHQQQHGSTIRM